MISNYHIKCAEKCFFVPASIVVVVFGAVVMVIVVVTGGLVVVAVVVTVGIVIEGVVVIVVAVVVSWLPDAIFIFYAIWT